MMMTQSKRTRVNTIGVVCCSLLALLLVGSSSKRNIFVECRSRGQTLPQQHVYQSRSRNTNQVQQHYDDENEIPDYRHDRKQRDRNLFITGRKNGPTKKEGGPPKKGLTPPGMGEVGPDGMPDLVVYHYANQPIDDGNNDASITDNNDSVSLESSTKAFPGLAEFDRTQQSVGRTRMRGKVLTGSNTRGSLGFGWGNRGRDGGDGGKGKGGKGLKSDPGCYRRAQNALRKKRGKSNKSDKYGGDDDDDDDDGYICGGDDDDDDDDSGRGDDDDDDNGRGDDDDDDNDNNDEDDDDDRNGDDHDHNDGGDHGHDHSDGGDHGHDHDDDGDDEGDDKGDDDTDGSGGDVNGDGSGTEGVCREFDVAFTSPDSETGEVKVIFLQGKENEPSAQGIAALVKAFDPPVKISDSTGFDVKVGFSINTATAQKVDDMDATGTFTEEDVALTLDEVVSPPTALEVAGCTETAMATAGAYYEEHKVEKEDYRRLEGEETKLVILEDWLCLNGNCERDGGSNCDLECSTTFFYYGDLSASEVRERINAALLKFMMLLDDVTHWYPEGQTPSVSIEQIETNPNGGSAIQDETTGQARESTKAGPYIGAAAGALALLLLLILFVRRSRRNQDDEEVSHLKLEDDDGDDTFIQEIASDDGTPERQYQSRGAHVIGENDSIFSDWTGYTGKKPSNGGYGYDPNTGRLGHVSTDVHHCSSATCEVCELKRQQGVNFIATTTPSRPGVLPNDASREYAADDTVSL